MWTENAKCSQINIPLYEFCHSCLCFSVFGDFKLCVFQPVFERACLQLCSLILFVRSAYIQGYDFIWTHVKIDASQKSSEAGRAAFVCGAHRIAFWPSWALCKLKAFWKITFFKSWFVSRLSGAPMLDEVLWLFFGVNILLWAPPPHNRSSY